MTSLIAAEEGRAEAEARVITLSDKLELEHAEIKVVIGQLTAAQEAVRVEKAAATKARARADGLQAQLDAVREQLSSSQVDADDAVKQQEELRTKVVRLEKLVFGSSKPLASTKARRRSRNPPGAAEPDGKGKGKTVKSKPKPPLPKAAVQHARKQQQKLQQQAPRSTSRGRSKSKRRTGGTGNTARSLSQGKPVGSGWAWASSPARSVSTIGFVADSDGDDDGDGDDFAPDKATHGKRRGGRLAHEAERSLSGTTRVNSHEQAALRTAAAIVQSANIRAYAQKQLHDWPQPLKPLRRGGAGRDDDDLLSWSSSESEPTMDNVPVPAATRWFAP